MPLQEQELRIVSFANFFKRYMSVSAILAASVPIPVAALKLIPAYSQQRGFLSVYSSLLCFLLVAFVFSIRHRLARPMFFSHNWRCFLLAMSPAIFILLTVASIFGYHAALQSSLAEWAARGATATTAELLDKSDLMEIPKALPLALLYLGIFLFAEAAFVLMALREYLQDALHLDETALLCGTNPRKAPPQPSFAKDF